MKESVLETVCPHVMGMYSLYLVWAYPVVLALACMADRKVWVPLAAAKLNGWLESLCSSPWISRMISERVFSASHDEAYLTCWILALAVPALVVAVARISLKWLFIVGAMGALALGLRFASPLGDRTSPYYVDNMENVALIACGLAGMLGTEIYRRAHRYVVTDQRIIIHSGALGERSIFYGRIDDLVLTKPLLGSIFGFGSIVPVTSSGLGLGSDTAGATAMAMGQHVGVAVSGSQSETVVRPSISQVLFNVPDPDRIYALIASQVGATS